MSEILDEEKLGVAIYNYLYELAQSWDAWRNGETSNPITYEDGEKYIMSLIKANTNLKKEQPLPKRPEIYNNKQKGNNMTYEEWKLKLIRLIVDEKRVKEQTGKWKLSEISCVLNDDCDYPQGFKEGDTPEDIWQGEMDSIRDSQ